MTMETVKRQAEIIHDLRERLAVAERLVRVDTALARQLSESIRTNARHRAAFKPLRPFRWPPGFSRYSSRVLVAGLVTTLVFSRCEILVLDAYGAAAAAGAFALAAGLASQITAPIDAMLGPLIPAAASLIE